MSKPSRDDLRLAQLKARFVAHDDYRELRRTFDRLLTERRADFAMGHSFEAQGIALLGASGSGKSTAVARLIETHPDIGVPGEGDEIAEIVRLSVPSPATLKYVGGAMLHALGFPLVRDKSAGLIWDQVRHFLRLRQTLFVHLDEAQDLYATKGEVARGEVINTLKSLMNNRDWPVGLILSGTLDLAQMIDADIQLGRRLHVIRLQKITWVSHGREIRGMFGAYLREAGLEPDPVLGSEDFLQRLIHAGGGEFGLIVEMLLAGIKEAVLAGMAEIALPDFAESFRRKSGCIPALNPFLAETYQAIDVHRVLGQDPFGEGGL